MSMRWAVGDKPIFQRYGKRYEVIGEAGNGVYAVDLEVSDPKPMYYMSKPDAYEEAPKPEPTA